MLSKRAFLGGAGALLTAPMPLGRAAEGDGRGTIRLEARARSLAPSASAAETIAMRTGAIGDGLDLAAARPAALPLLNTTQVTVTPEWQGLRGIGSLDDTMPELSPGSSSEMTIQPREAGTGLLRAAPSAAHPAARGARMAVVVRDASAPLVDQDRVFLLEDWLLGADGQLRFGSIPPADAVTSIVSVNGEVRPQVVTVAPRARLRMRFVNGSVQRLMLVACAGAKPLIAAIDGQPSDLFAPSRNTVPIGPGARYDLLLDAPESNGAEVRFTLKPTLAVAGTLEDARDLVVVRTAGAALPSKPPAAPLPANPNLPTEIPLETAHRADLTIAGTPGTATAGPRGWTVNGVAGADAKSKPVLSVRSGDAVVFGLMNASATLVPLRIGGQVVRLLHAKDDGWEPYWRDTLLLPPGSRNHVAFVADTPGLWPVDSGFDDLTLAGLFCCFAVTRR